MTQAVQKLIPQLKQLSPQERAELASFLIHSLDGEGVEMSDDEFFAELERSRAEAESGRDPGTPFREFMRELRAES